MEYKILPNDSICIIFLKGKKRIHVEIMDKICYSKVETKGALNTVIKAEEFNGTQVKVVVNGVSFVCEKAEFEDRVTLADMLQTIAGLKTSDAEKTARQLQESYE
jgi:hypothetical protein